MFGPDMLPRLIMPIRAYIPPFQTLPLPFDQYTLLQCMLVVADLEAFEELCSFLKALALDDEDLQLSLKRNGWCALLSLGSPKLIFRRTLSMSAQGAV